MFNWLDRSPALAKLLEKISTAMSRRRGLPVVIGVGCVVISFVLQTINVFAGNMALELVGVIVLHVGVLIALIGLLMAEALGG